jgi:hypothetical protein
LPLPQNAFHPLSKPIGHNQLFKGMNIILKAQTNEHLWVK